MLEEKYNASVDNHEDASAVRSFLDRARTRFLSGRRSSGSESAVASTLESWRWAEWMLEKIEFSHRGDIDSFNAQCRSFRDRKTMEWYAALYLMSYATTDDLRQRIADAGDRCAADFAFDREWLSNCPCVQGEGSKGAMFWLTANHAKLERSVPTIPPRKDPCEHSY